MESLASVLPLTAIVFILSITLLPLSSGALVLFLFGAVMLIIGMGFFTMGADMSMMPMVNKIEDCLMAVIRRLAKLGRLLINAWGMMIRR